jgi:hypothetical protein
MFFNRQTFLKGVFGFIVDQSGYVTSATNCTQLQGGGGGGVIVGVKTTAVAVGKTTAYVAVGIMEMGDGDAAIWVSWATAV